MLAGFGPAAGAAVITFLAYLVGVLLARPSQWVVDQLLNLSWSQRPDSSDSSTVQAAQLARRTAVAIVEADVHLPSEFQQESSSSEPRGVDQIAGLLERQMASEVPLVATRLLADHRDLFDRFDRADSEGSFRFAVALPLIAIGPLLAWRADFPLWGVLSVTVIVLFASILLVVDGVRKRRESNDAIYQSVFVGKVQFPSIQATLAAVEENRERGRQEAESRARELAASRAQREADQQESERMEAAAAAEAREVRIAVRGGAGQGSRGHTQMTSVKVDLTNDATRPVVVTSFWLDPPLSARNQPARQIRLGPQDTVTETVEIHPIDAKLGDLSGTPLTRYTAGMHYRLGDREWVRDSREGSQPHPKQDGTVGPDDGSARDG